MPLPKGIQPVRLVARALARAARALGARRRSAGAAHATDERLRIALECAEHAFWELDLATGVMSAEPHGILGYARGDVPLTVAAWAELVHPDDRARSRGLLLDHVEGRTKVYRAEYRFRAMDGTYPWVFACGRAIARGADGRALRMAGTLTDVTATKALREQLHAAERLASIGTLAAGVAHEVNNPLAYVTSNLAFLDEALARAAPGGAGLPIDELRHAVVDAREGAARVRDIVQGLRQFARPRRGAARAPVDLRAEIDRVLGLTRSEITRRASLRVELPVTLPPVVAAPNEVGQVLVNLLVNAAQAIPDGSAAAHEVTLAARAEPANVVLEVRDTGAGIAPADRPRIFDPFFTTRDIGDGTGLGLSICHGIVAALGGTIDVESAPGRGTTFRVTLPAARDAEHPRAR
jgi:PAS domain S-box-containing protein